MSQLTRLHHKCHRRFISDKETGLLYRKIKKKGEETTYSLVIPQENIFSILKYFHDSYVGGHKGIRKTRLAIRKSSFWWPRLNKDVEKYVKRCSTCQFKKPSNKSAPEPISVIENLPFKSLKPFQAIAIDMMDFNQHPSHSRRYVILAICLLTGYCVGKAIIKPTARAVGDFLFKKFILNGRCPKFILSDRAPNLKDKEMDTLCKKLNIRRGLTARYNPRCNGKVERANGWFKKIMKTFVSEHQKDWSYYVKTVCFIMNTGISDASGYSPHFLVHGTEPIIRRHD